MDNTSTTLTPEIIGEVYASERSALSRVMHDGVALQFHDREDAVQDAALRSLQRLKKGPRDDKNPKAWLRREVGNAQKDLKRARRRRRRRIVLGQDAAPPLNSGDSPWKWEHSAVAEWHLDFKREDDADRQVPELLEKLPDDRVILEANLAGKSQKQLACELGVSQPTACRRQRAAFDRVKGIWDSIE